MLTERTIAIINEVVPPTVIGSMLIIWRAVMYEKYRTFQSIIGAVFVAVPCGIVTFGVMREFGYGEWTAVSVCAFSVLFSEHAFKYIIENPDKISNFLKGWIAKK